MKWLLEKLHNSQLKFSLGGGNGNLIFKINENNLIVVFNINLRIIMVNKILKKMINKYMY